MADPHELTIKWQGKEIPIVLEQGDTVGELKRKIESQTEVQPKRQKLLGLKAKAGGGLPADSVPVSDLLLKPGMKVMMMGCAPSLPSVSYVHVVKLGCVKCAWCMNIQHVHQVCACRMPYGRGLHTHTFRPARAGCGSSACKSTAK